MVERASGHRAALQIGGASLAAALILFVWGFFLWAAGPLGSPVKPVPTWLHPSVAAMDVPELASGTYAYPFEPGEDAESQARMAERLRTGPVLMLHIRAAGPDPLGGQTLLAGFVHFLVSAAIVSTLAWWLLPALPSWGGRVLFVAALGLFSAVFARLGQPLWFSLPFGFHLFYALSDLVGWALAGVAVGALVRPAGAEAAEARVAAA